MRVEPASAYTPLYAKLHATPGLQDWAQALPPWIDSYFQQPAHGDYPGWLQALKRLPPSQPQARLDHAAPRLGDPDQDQQALRQTLMAFHPWRKGPLELGGVSIDTEWRSDWKWARLAGHVNLEGHRILDIGCGNGYFGWRMLAAGAEWVAGVDPTLVFVMQWLACRHFAGELHNYVLPARLEDLPRQLTGFDTVFSMGVLYHRKHPMAHLQRLKQLIRPGGQVILETLVIEGDQQTVLVPAGRYARMRNVWFIPSVQALEGWLRRIGFRHIRLLDVSLTTVEEQRSTPWMQFESLQQSLDPENPARTIEGYPAPRRALWLIS